jgi:hypothetical protein
LDFADFLDKRPKQGNKDVRLGAWNVRRFYRAGSLVRVSKELSEYRLELVGVQEVIWRTVAPNKQENTDFPMEMGMRIIN